MEKFNIFRDIIDKHWYNEDKELNLIDLFSIELQQLPPGQLVEIMKLFLTCTGKSLADEKIEKASKSICSIRYYISDGITFSFDILSRFLYAIALAKYKLNDIVLSPSEIRKQRLDQITYKIGFDSDTLQLIFDKFSLTSQG